MSSLMNQSFTLPCGQIVKNRVCKAAMTERIANGNDSFAHVLGYAGVLTDTSFISKKFNRNSWNDALYSYANGLIEGKSGLEKTFDDVLKGIDSILETLKKDQELEKKKR